MMLTDLFRQQYVPLRLLGRSPRTLQYYTWSIRAFGTFLGHPATLDDLTDENLAGFAQSFLARERSPATANANLRPLKVLWNFARKRRLLATVSELSKVPEYGRVPRAWTVEEIGAMLKSARLERGTIGHVAAAVFWVALLLAFFDTGVRKSALLKCRPRDFCPVRRLLWVRAENQKQRREQVFALSDQTCAAICNLDPPGTDCHLREWLFPWDKDRWSKTHWPALDRAFKRILRRAKLEDAGKFFHKFRASHASYVELAIPGAAQHVLGHSSPEVTRRYLDPIIVSQSRLVDRLPRP